MAVIATLGAAVLYAVASVAQQRPAEAQPSERSLRLGLLVDLAAKPLWVAGNVAEVAAYGLQFIALRRGSLTLVQPLLVSGLLFALPLGAAASRRPMRAPDWIGAVLVAGGLALFLVVASPGRARSDTTTLAWAVVVACTGSAVGVLVAVGRAGGQVRRGVCFAAAAGLLYALTASLTEACGALLDHGVLHALAAWQPYALVACGIAGMVVVQSAFQAGPLRWSLPTLTVVDPLASIAIGVFAFHDHITADAGAIALEGLGLTAIVTGVFLLTRSLTGRAAEQR
jgi:hypothetical protein